MNDINDFLVKNADALRHLMDFVCVATNESIDEDERLAAAEEICMLQNTDVFGEFREKIRTIGNRRTDQALNKAINREAQVENSPEEAPELNDVEVDNIDVNIIDEISPNKYDFNKENYPNLFGEQEKDGLIGIFSPRH